MNNKLRLTAITAFSFEGGGWRIETGGGGAYHDPIQSSFGIGKLAAGSLK
jgi:hypothetical protein